ncbi:zinc-ribbon domain-containing protein [uncultured Parolsenella sp.]
MPTIALGADRTGLLGSLSCANCGHEVKDGTKLCPSCGAAVAAL